MPRVDARNDDEVISTLCELFTTQVDQVGWRAAFVTLDGHVFGTVVAWELPPSDHRRDGCSVKRTAGKKVPVVDCDDGVTRYGCDGIVIGEKRMQDRLTKGE